MKKPKIVVSKNGPYLVSGNVPLGKEIAEVGSSGEPEKWGKGEQYPRREDYALCRCGDSKHKPFCDGTHATSGFDGTQTASRKKYLEQSKKIEGQGIDLTDAECLCSGARFCHPKGGAWKLTQNSQDPLAKKEAIRQAGHCPSGRLVAWDKKTGKPIEPELNPSISLVEDPQAQVSGPIWVKGGVPVEKEDGSLYEKRNRVTLCCCGESRNKPFCDASHIKAKFKR
jgi:CDGSH-type Zn-finger protein